MQATEHIESGQKKMEQALERFKKNLSRLRTGRASPALLENISVDYYGNATPINQVANVVAGDARTLLVQVWEKSMVAAVEKAIRDSGLGLNPAASGAAVRVPLPPMTQERRLELVKVVKAEGEDAKIGVRNARRDANDGLKKLSKDKEISTDEERRYQDQVQKLTDKYIALVDGITADKEKEVTTL